MRFVAVCAVIPMLVACGGSDEGGQSSQKLDDGCARTPFKGDELCIGAPDPSEGIQLHMGPESYDPVATEPFMIQPGEEFVECFTMKANNPEPVHYFEQKNRMRPGSHHMIIRIVDENTPLGWGRCALPLTGGFGGIPGSQTQVRDIPDGEIAEENKGFGREMPANATVQFEMHYVNTQPDATPLLREAWVNLYFKPKEEITNLIQSVSLIGGLQMRIQPGTREIVHNSSVIQTETRIVELFGHFHANTERFSAWRTRDGKKELIYESFNWGEPAVLLYDSANENPAPNPDKGRDGGWSGHLDVKKGDIIDWECEVNNQTDGEITFANEAYTAEMCILFGGGVPNRLFALDD